MADAELRPIRPFDIDNGELDGLRPNEIFVLGYELAMVDARIQSGEIFNCPVHSDNVARIRAELDRQGRRYSIAWMEGDESESWSNLRVFSK
jgi:hypothetical protein